MSGGSCAPSRGEPPLEARGRRAGGPRGAWPRRKLLRGTRVVGVAVAVSACEPAPPTECVCADPAVVVEVPADRAEALASATLSGEACPDARPVCAESAGAGCARLSFRASAAGSCTLSLGFSSGAAAFSATVDFYALPCCPGYYAEPPAAATIEVPEGDDAGADG